MASEVALARLEGHVEHLEKLFEIFEASGSFLEVISGAHASFFCPLRPSWDLSEASWKLFGSFLERLGDNVVAQSHFV